MEVYCWKYISADNVPGRPHFCTFIARLFAGLLFGWNRIPVEFEFRFLQPGEWDIGLFHQIFPKKFQLSQVVGGETYGERQARTLSNLSLTHEKGLESRIPACTFSPQKTRSNYARICKSAIVASASAVLMWFLPLPHPSSEFTTHSGGATIISPPEIGNGVGGGDTFGKAFYSPMVLSLVSRKTPMMSPTAHFLP